MNVTHEVRRGADGTFHVQDMHGFALGQHRVYDLDGFRRWKMSVKEAVEKNTGPACACGLGAGWVRELNGKTWRDARIAPKEESVAKANGGAKAGETVVETPAPAAPESPAPAEAAVKEAKVKAMKTKTPAKPAKAKAEKPKAERPKARPAEPKRTKAERADAAKRAWAKRRERFGKNGIGKKRPAKRE